MAEGQSTTVPLVEYRDTAGYPGYRVGDDGTVWTAWVKVSLGGRAGTAARLGSSWRQLAPARGSGGYLSVALRVEHGTYRRVRVHLLVLTAFAGPPPDGAVCRHLDGNPANNRRGNLVWGTQAENAADTAAHGRSLRGTRAHSNKLTEQDVRDIRRLFREGVGRREVAARFGIHAKHADGIRAGRFWGWLPDEVGQSCGETSGCS
jgi:hypothetical protein